jgi:hypothetical protein
MSRAPAVDAHQDARRAFARSMRQSTVMLRGAHAALPWLAATRTPQLNMGSLYMTEEYATTLIGPNVDLVVVPDPEFMYSTTSWPFLDVVQQTKGFTAKTTRRPVVLNYPLSDSDRLLVHPIFAHELGHPAVDEHRLVRDVEDVLDADSAFATAFTSLSTNPAALWPQSNPSARVGTVRAWMTGWIEELLCDLLALEVSGPAFLWAFAAFVMPLSYGRPAATHPPNTMRVAMALAHLAGRGWRPYMERVAPAITRWFDTIATDARGPLPEPYAFLRDQLLARVDVLTEVAAARTGPAAFMPANSVAEADEAARLLKQQILPIGLAAPLGSAAILLGGWQDAFRRHGDKPAALSMGLGDQQLQDLIGKAIEMSTVTRAWNG